MFFKCSVENGEAFVSRFAVKKIVAVSKLLKMNGDAGGLGKFQVGWLVRDKRSAENVFRLNNTQHRVYRWRREESDFVLQVTLKQRQFSVISFFPRVISFREWS